MKKEDFKYNFDVHYAHDQDLIVSPPFSFTQNLRHDLQ